MSVAKVTLHVPSQRRAAIEAAKSLAESLETRIHECQTTGPLKQWTYDVLGSVHHLVREVETAIAEDGE